MDVLDYQDCCNSRPSNCSSVFDVKIELLDSCGVTVILTYMLGYENPIDKVPAAVQILG